MKKTIPQHVANIISERQRLKEQMHGAGSHLADLRLIEGLSQSSMAAAIGISRSMLNYIEQGKRALSLPTAHTVCNIFDVTLDKLLTGWSQQEVTEAMNRRQVSIEAGQLRLDRKDIPFDLPDDLLASWYHDVRRGRMTEGQFAEKLRGWKPTGASTASADGALLFKLDNKPLVDLVKGWAAALDVTPAVLLEALLVDFLADAVVWNKAFPDTPFGVPMIRRDGATNELLLGTKLLASLIESKTKFLQDGMRHARNGLELSLRDELVVDKLIEETSGEAAVKVERKKGK
jgi:transcriptional regulator with XRE-family HTH domain